MGSRRLLAAKAAPQAAKLASGAMAKELLAAFKRLRKEPVGSPEETAHPVRIGA